MDEPGRIRWQTGWNGAVPNPGNYGMQTCGEAWSGGVTQDLLLERRVLQELLLVATSFSSRSVAAGSPGGWAKDDGKQ